MTALTVGAVMDALGVQLSTVTGLRVFDFEPLSAQPPFAFVGMPDTLTYDQTFGRGSDRMTIPVVVCVGNQVDRAARDAISAYADGASIKAALQAATAFSCRVTDVTFGSVMLAGGNYFGATFSVDVSA